MGSICHLVSHTDLSIPTIHKILFDGIEIKDDHLRNDVIRVEGYRCSVSLLPDPDLSENLILDLPENLIVSFSIGYSYEGLVMALKVVMNWLRNTAEDSAFVRDVYDVLLMRVDGQTVSNNSDDAWGYYGMTELIDIPHEKAGLRFARWTDYLYIRSPHNTPQVATNFCQHIVADYEIEIGEISSGKYANVDMDSLSIEIYSCELNPDLPLRDQGTMDNRYGFCPTSSMIISYKKKFWARDSERDTHLRDIVLQGVIGLVRTMDYGLALKLDSPSRHVLVYHDGDLTLLQDPFWTEDRLLLFEDIPYKFKDQLT